MQKNCDIALLLFVKSVRFIVVRNKLRTCDTSKTDLFAKIVYSLRSLTILTRSFILRPITGYCIYLGFFFRFILVWTFLFLLIFLKINWKLTLHTNDCSRHVLEALYWVWDLSKFDSKDTTTMSLMSFWGFG